VIVKIQNLNVIVKNNMTCPFNNKNCSDFRSELSHKMETNCPNRLIEKDSCSLSIQWNDLNSNTLKNYIYPNSDVLKNRIDRYKELTGSIKLPKRVCWVGNDISSSWLERGTLSTPYAILSYVWGDNRRDDWDNYKDPSNEPQTNEKKELNGLFNINNSQIGYNNTNKMTRLGYKSLQKALKVCQSLKIEYLWTDQLCINQNNEEDQLSEIPKMGQYYGNATVTLIAIHINIGGEDIRDPRNIIGRIVNSEWFTRMWTLQEGMLSQRTIFMFDDCLVDGGYLASVFGAHSSLIAEKEFSTPLGWINGLHKPIHMSNKRISVNLNYLIAKNQNRKATKFIDNINAILGLLNTHGKSVPAFPNEMFPPKKQYSESDIRKILEYIANIAFPQYSWSSTDFVNFMTEHLIKKQQTQNQIPTYSQHQPQYSSLPTPQRTLQPLLDKGNGECARIDDCNYSIYYHQEGTKNRKHYIFVKGKKCEIEKIGNEWQFKQQAQQEHYKQ